MVVRVDYVNAAERIQSDRPWLVELARIFSTRSPTADDAPIGPPMLNAVIAHFANVKIVVRIKNDAVRILELAQIRAFATQNFFQLWRWAADVEDLYAMITSVSNPQSPRLIKRNALRPQKLTWLAAVTSPLQNKFATRVKFLNPIEIAIFRNEIVAFRILSDVRNKSELARSKSPLSANRSFGDQRSVGRIRQHSKIVRIRHQQVPIVSDRQSARKSNLGIRQAPTFDELSVTIKSLNQTGFVGDIKSVIRVDRQGPGLLKATVI